MSVIYLQMRGMMIQEHFAIFNPRWLAVCFFLFFIYLLEIQTASCLQAINRWLKAQPNSQKVCWNEKKNKQEQEPFLKRT